MIQLTKENWSFLRSYNPSILDRNFVYSKIKKKADFEQFVELLYGCKKMDDPEICFDCILSKFPISINAKEYTKVCRIFLKELWHRNHESMIGFLQDEVSGKDNENIEALDWLLNNLPEFYKHDDDLKYPFIRKIMYAIASQPKNEALEYFTQKLNSPDERIREFAKIQIKRINNRI